MSTQSTITAPESAIALRFEPRPDALKDSIIRLREFGMSLGEHEFATKSGFTNYKNQLRLLQDCVTELGSLVRSSTATEEEIGSARTVMFDSLRKVMKLFCEPSEGFKIAPQANDESALMTLAFKLSTVHSELYKSASRSARDAQKAVKEFVVENQIESLDDLSTYSEEIQNQFAELATTMASANKYFEAVKELPGSTTQEAMPYSEERFRKGFENLICDRILERKAMTSEAVREAKKARNAKSRAKRAANNAVKNHAQKSENK